MFASETIWIDILTCWWLDPWSTVSPTHYPHTHTHAELIICRALNLTLAPQKKLLRFVKSRVRILVSTETSSTISMYSIWLAPVNRRLSSGWPYYLQEPKKIKFKVKNCQSFFLKLKFDIWFFKKQMINPLFQASLWTDLWHLFPLTTHQDSDNYLYSSDTLRILKTKWFYSKTWSSSPPVISLFVLYYKLSLLLVNGLGLDPLRHDYMHWWLWSCIPDLLSSLRKGSPVKILS